MGSREGGDIDRVSWTVGVCREIARFGQRSKPCGKRRRMLAAPLLDVEGLSDELQRLHQFGAGGIKHPALCHCRGLIGHLHGPLSNNLHCRRVLKRTIS